MQIKVKFLDNLRLEASFDDYKIITDQPIRYKGDGTAPSPFDYFLASSALCAAYFTKVYCKARNIPTEDIVLTQDNVISHTNRYDQSFNINVELPDSISEKDKDGILKSIDRCTVKKVVQEGPKFNILTKKTLGIDPNFESKKNNDNSETFIIGKELPLEKTIQNMTSLLNEIGIKIEIASWRNPVPHVWSVHIRDADSPMCFTNGKGVSKDAALCSALGEYFERLSTNYFYNDFYLGEEIANSDFVHYAYEKWFQVPEDNSIPADLMDNYLLSVYNPSKELKASNLIDTNSGNAKRGICALPFTKNSSKETVYIPVNIVGNLYVSNGMSAGNTIIEARVQCLSEIFERAIKNQIISEEITLPDVPSKVLAKYPNIVEGIKSLEKRGFPIIVKDASLGGIYPVACVTLMNPKTGGVFASFGAHPNFEVAVERSLTELLQGRSFEGLNDVPPPSFNEYSVKEHNNIVDHFIDSTGVVSWKFFSSQADYEFVHWNFDGTIEEENSYLMNILEQMQKEIYIADYECLGAKACRILVPDFSEIYPVDDLIWDNNNLALEFREEITNIHNLNENEILDLVDKLEESELDDYMPISELIGITFDENSVWGKLTIAELKAIVLCKIGQFERAKTSVEHLNTFSDTNYDRKLFYQALDNILEIKINKNLILENYIDSFNKIYSHDLVSEILKLIDPKNKNLFDLYPLDSNFANNEKHKKLIQSYKKLISKRTKQT